MGQKKSKEIKFVKSIKLKEGKKGIESTYKKVREESFNEDRNKIVENEGLLLQSEVNMETGKGLVNIYQFKIMSDEEQKKTLYYTVRGTKP